MTDDRPPPPADHSHGALHDVERTGVGGADPAACSLRDLRVGGDGPAVGVRGGTRIGAGDGGLRQRGRCPRPPTPDVRQFVVGPHAYSGLNVSADPG